VRKRERERERERERKRENERKTVRERERVQVCVGGNQCDRESKGAFFGIHASACALSVHALAHLSSFAQ